MIVGLQWQSGMYGFEASNAVENIMPPIVTRPALITLGRKAVTWLDA
jgi:hypothetical protein